MKVIYKLLSTMQHLMYIFIQAGLPIGKRCFSRFRKGIKKSLPQVHVYRHLSQILDFLCCSYVRAPINSLPIFVAVKFLAFTTAIVIRRKGGRYNSSEHVTIAQEAFLRLPSLLFGMSQPSELLHQLVASANGVLLITQNYFPVAKMLYNFHIFVLR